MEGRGFVAETETLAGGRVFVVAMVRDTGALGVDAFGLGPDAIEGGADGAGAALG